MCRKDPRPDGGFRNSHLGFGTCDCRARLRRDRRLRRSGAWILVNAPHPEYEVVANEWNHSYSREKAAYPIESVRDNKFWINVARVDNTLGDRKLLPTRYGKFE